MDSGKTVIKIPVDAMPLEAVGAVADRLGVALRRGGLGDVVSHGPVGYEPFTPESPAYGRQWNQIVLDLTMTMDLRRAADLFVAAGAPFSSILTYTDQMLMCSESLGRT